MTKTTLRTLTLSLPRLATILRVATFAQTGALLGLGLLLGVLSASAASSTESAQAVPPTIPTPGSLPTPGTVDQELVVDSVSTERYPRLTVRFTLQPFDNTPPQYLETRDVGIVEGGVVDTPDQVYTVGRVPTHGFGTYEAVWPAHAAVQPGDTVTGKLVLYLHNRPEVSTEYRYIRPMPRTAEAEAAPVAPMVLKSVPLPNPNAINVPLASAIAACFMGTALLCAAGALAWREHQRRKQERLAIWVGRSGQERARAAARAASGRKQITISPAVQALGKLGNRLVPSGQAEKIRRNLVLAGKPTNQHFTRFVAAKAGLSIGLFLFGFWVMVGLAPFITAVAVGLCLGTLGFVLPSTWLGRTIKKRQYMLRRALPDALDLMTIGVSAGLAFDGALNEIIEKWDNELSHEFSVVLGELRIGVGRREALLNLADRTQVEEIQIMVSQLIQAEEMGMSLTDTLNKLSDQMRLRRRQHAEELAQKAAIKMLIPLVFLIFPALFVVILGPAAQDLYTHFMSGNGP